MVDTTLPQGAPGIALSATESYGGPIEALYGEGDVTTTSASVMSTAGVDLKLYSVVHVAANGELTLADETADGPTGILTAPVVLTAGQSTTVDLYRSGHWNMDALEWDATYDTDAKKKAAFEGSISPTIFVSKPKHSPDAIDV